MARAAQGTFLLRMEDIDQSRAKTQWERQIHDDLTWLGLSWETPVLKQSENIVAYTAALEKLHSMGVLYPCYCTRKDIRAALSAPQEGAAPVYGPDGLVYPGTCRDLKTPPDASTEPATRLDMRKALSFIEANDPEPLCFDETGAAASGCIVVDSKALKTRIGDVVVARRDMGTSYHLSVVLDDAAQGVTHVIRGQDLFEATRIHVLLQALLGLPTPEYLHHRLIRDPNGKRLAKRDDARAIAKYRVEGATPQDIRAMVGL